MPQLIRLKGLDQKKNYSLKEINLYPGVVSSIKSNSIYSGDFFDDGCI